MCDSYICMQIISLCRNSTEKLYIYVVYNVWKPLALICVSFSDPFFHYPYIPPTFHPQFVCVFMRPSPSPGISHLASVRIVGNKGYPRRSQSVNRGGKIQNDVNLLSYYLKNRKAAAQHETAPLVLASGN